MLRAGHWSHCKLQGRGQQRRGWEPESQSKTDRIRTGKQKLLKASPVATPRLLASTAPVWQLESYLRDGSRPDKLLKNRDLVGRGLQELELAECR